MNTFSFHFCAADVEKVAANYIMEVPRKKNLEIQSTCLSFGEENLKLVFFLFLNLQLLSNKKEC